MNTERGDPDGSSSDVEEVDRACTGLEHPLREEGSAQKRQHPSLSAGVLQVSAMTYFPA